MPDKHKLKTHNNSFYIVNIAKQTLKLLVKITNCILWRYVVLLGKWWKSPRKLPFNNYNGVCKMTGKFKTGIRALSVLLTVVILIGILPMSVFASELNNDYLKTDLLTEELPDTITSDGNDEESLILDDVAEDEKGEASFVIVGEDAAKREESVKHFKNTDGSFIAVDYGYPIHYKDDTKQSQDVDYSIIKSEK